jgi:hypothetical protein
LLSQLWRHQETFSSKRPFGNSYWYANVVTTFYLGTHYTHWLLRPGPWFLSRNGLARVKKFPRSIGPWALDSSAFTEISTHGRWTISAREYAAIVQRAAVEIGNLDWAAPMDFMCEPHIIAKTGLSVRIHQDKTLSNFLELRSRLGPLVIPVLQGWTLGDYLDHAEAYDKAGVTLKAERIVGVGSVCRRQAMISAANLFQWLYSDGLSLHAFGIKLQGLQFSHDKIKSGDSMSWSFDARHSQPLPGHSHKSCSNCLEFAEDWRENKISKYLEQSHAI